MNKKILAIISTIFIVGCLTGFGSAFFIHEILGPQNIVEFANGANLTATWHRWASGAGEFEAIEISGSYIDGSVGNSSIFLYKDGRIDLKTNNLTINGKQVCFRAGSYLSGGNC